MVYVCTFLKEKLTWIRSFLRTSLYVNLCRFDYESLYIHKDDRLRKVVQDEYMCNICN